MSRDLLIVCDIDGTVADPSHRVPVLRAHGYHGPIHHIPREHDGALRAFVHDDLLARDEPIARAFDCLTALYNHRRVQLAFVTGRGEAHRDVTFTWIARHMPGIFPPFGHAMTRSPYLCMRPASEDTRASHLVKADLARKVLRETATRPALWFDDDPDMLRGAAQLGFAPMVAPDCWNDVVMEVVRELCLEVA